MQAKKDKPTLPSVWNRMLSKNSEWPDKVTYTRLNKIRSTRIMLPENRPKFHLICSFSCVHLG